MGEPVFFTTPNGEQMTILARDDYEALVEASEEAADIHAVARFKDRFGRGEEEFLPGASVQRMIDGESAIKVWREHRQLSPAMLADAAGIEIAALNNIEVRTLEASLSTLKRIAEALHVSLDDLV